MTGDHIDRGHQDMKRTCCVLVVLATAVALAQTPRPYTTPGFLKAWEWSGQSGDLAHGGTTAAETKALVSKLLELRELLKASPVADRPVGYNTILTGNFEPFNAPERP